MRAFVTGIMGSIVCIVCFLVLRMLFVAPFLMYREKERAQRELHDFVNGDTPDLPFGDAIALVNESFPERDYSDEKIAEQIVRMAFREKIRAWGQPPLLGSMSPLASTPVEIPHQFFYDPNYGPTEDGGYLFEILTSLPGWPDWQEHEKYLNVMVNRGQIVAAFSNKIDPKE